MITALKYVVNENENCYHHNHGYQEIEALLAGTLALMTRYAESGCAQGTQRICDNLLQISAHADLPWEFRIVAAKLGARWTLPRGDDAAARGSVPLH